MSASFIVLVGRAASRVHVLRQTQIDTFATYSRITLWVYDIVLNLDREKTLIWKEKLRPSSLLYYAVRYPVIARQIFYLCYTNPKLYVSQVCDAWYRFVSILALLVPRVAIALSFILRVYAVMHGGLFFVAVLSVLGILSSALDIVQVKQISCTEVSNPLSFVITFLSLIVFDVISTGLILWQLFHVIKQQNGTNGIKSLANGSITALILRSGILYFVTITGIQLGAVILYFLPQGLYSTVMNDYTLIISSILISRLILDLKGFFRKDTVDMPGDGVISSLNFAPNALEYGASTTQRSNASGHWTNLVKDFEGGLHDYNEEQMEMTTHPQGEVEK